MAKLAIRMEGRPERVAQVPVEGAALGRDTSCDIVLEDGAVSRRHCEIRPGVDGFWLLDLGGRNPVLCNGARVTGRVRLQTGDLIRLGRVDLLFVCSPEEGCLGVSGAADGNVCGDVLMQSPLLVEVPAVAAASGAATTGETSERLEFAEALTAPGAAQAPDLSVAPAGQAGQMAQVVFASAPSAPLPARMDAAQEVAGAAVSFAVLTGRTVYEAIGPDDLRQPLPQRPPTEAIPVFEPEVLLRQRPSRAQERRQAADIPEGLSPQQLAELRELRARNDLWAKVIIFLLFGIPFVLIDLYLIWYFFLQ